MGVPIFSPDVTLDGCIDVPRACPPLVLLHQDEQLIAVAKPAGLLVHATALDAHDTRNARDLLQVQMGAPMWPLHRLDKGTSGVLLFARDAEAARTLRQPFEAGSVEKRYLALVRGWPDASGEIDYPLARDPEHPSTGQSRLEAQTRYRTLARHAWPVPDGRHDSCRVALVEVQPLQGRRHQIRRHFKHIAHPLIGDSTHGKGPLNRALASWLGCTRLWLHALEIGLPGRPPIRCEPGREWRRSLPLETPSPVMG